MEQQPKRKPPFDMQFVMGKTFKNIDATINFSMTKTLSRLGDFEDDDQKKREIFQTIQVLSAVKGILEEFRKENPHLFNSNKDD